MNFQSIESTRVSNGVRKKLKNKKAIKILENKMRRLYPLHYSKAFKVSTIHSNHYALSPFHCRSHETSSFIRFNHTKLHWRMFGLSTSCTTINTYVYGVLCQYNFCSICFYLSHDFVDSIIIAVVVVLATVFFFVISTDWFIETAHSVHRELMVLFADMSKE